MNIKLSLQCNVINEITYQVTVNSFLQNQNQNFKCVTVKDVFLEKHGSQNIE